MKLSHAALFILILVSNGLITLPERAPNSGLSATTHIAPRIKPNSFVAKPWTAEPAGSLGRLSPEHFRQAYLADTSLEPMPRQIDSETADHENILHHSPQNAPKLMADITPEPLWDASLDITSAEPINLGALKQYKSVTLTEQVEGFIDKSPLQSKTHPCPALNKKIKAVGMEKQLTARTSVGVEYVYRGDCLKKSVAMREHSDIPNAEAVNIRLNMRF